MNLPPVVLTISGFDPCSGAGALLDLRVCSELDCYGIAAITALTVQNTSQVYFAQAVGEKVLTSTLEKLAEDFEIAAVKTGMLADEKTVCCVAEWVSAYRPAALVVDPVILSTSGKRLLSPQGVRTLIDRLLPLADLVTPNLPELAMLTGQQVNNLAASEVAAKALLRLGVAAVLVKGGHSSDVHVVRDCLVTSADSTIFAAERLDIGEVHGTGCALSAACVCYLARRLSLRESVTNALSYTRKLIKQSIKLGKGSRLLWKSEHWY